MYTPLPGENSVPLHEALEISLGAQEKAVFEVTPTKQGQTHQIPVVAISKLPDLTYTIDVDGTTRFGPNAPLPPTDPDDLTTTFLRALEMQRKITITVRDVRSTGADRTIETHVLGWEE